MIKNKINKNGFSFIELVSVIGVLVIIMTIAVVSLNNMRSQGRDSKRLSDIKAIQTALEFYYNRNHSYPTSIIPGESLIINGITYLDPVPTNPSPRNDGPCGNNDYVYETQNNRLSYTINFCLSTKSGSLNPGYNQATPAGLEASNPPFLCGEDVTYGEQTYGTTLIGTQCWMKQNLNIGNQLCSDQIGNDQCSAIPSDNHNIEKYCYNNDPSICEQYGALYTWYETVGLAHGDNSSGKLAEPIQGICPNSWHIPTNNDFYILESYLYDGQSTCDSNTNNDGDFSRCSNAGDKLKMADYCTIGSDCDITGFSIDMGGFAWKGTGSYSNIKSSAYLWESDISDTNNAFSRNFGPDGPGVARRDFYKAGRFQVRCIKD